MLVGALRVKHSQCSDALHFGPAASFGIFRSLLPQVSPHATPRWTRTPPFHRKALILLVGAQGLEPWTR